MGVYPLESLLSVRKYREDEAARTVKAAESEVKTAKDAVDARQSELQAFRLWRADEEKRRYAAVMGKPCTIKDIDDLKAGLAQLAAQEIVREEAVSKAEKAHLQAQTRLEGARLAAKNAQKETAKIMAHKDIWAEEDKRESERKEDLELEEFRPVSRKGAEAEGDDA